MKITKYPQSAILIEYKKKRILIDPGSYCYNENFKAENWGKIDILLITHTHKDHYLPEAIKIIKQNNPDLLIFSNKEVKEKLALENINCEIISFDEEKIVNDVKITGVKSIHGDLPPDASSTIKPDVIGFKIDDKFYHPGDTIYFEQKLKAEIIFVPICGSVVMNSKEAAKFSKDINPKLIIPIHYDSPRFPVDVNEFVNEMNGYNVKVLKNEESIELD